MGSYLCRRGRWYYFRLRIPRDLQRWFGGRVELKISLRTAKRTVAQSMVRTWLFQAEHLFSRIRRNNLTDEQIRKLVADHLKKTLADAEEDRLRGVGLLGEEDEDGEHGVSPLEGLELHLTEVKEDLARGRYGAVEPIVKGLLSENGLTVSPQDYLKLCRESMKTTIEGTLVELERMKGNYPPSYLTSSNPTISSALPSATPEEESPQLLSTLIEDYIKESVTGQKWSPKTQAENAAIFRLFLEIVGDREARMLNRRVLSEYRDTLLRLPVNINRNKAYRGKSVKELVELNVKKTLGVSSVNKHLSRIGSLLRWSTRLGYTSANHAEKLAISRRNSKESEKRAAYTQADLKKLLKSHAFVSPDTSRPERFWLPLVLLFSGARLNEAAQLYVEDIREVEGVLVFDINNDKDKTLKNASSRRGVPIHPALLGLGFAEYVAELRAQGQPRLWMNLERRRDGYGHSFSTWYGRYNRRHITKDSRKVLHSFRHTLVDALKQKKVEETIIAELVGHAHRGITMGVYGKSYEPRVLLDALNRLDYGIEVELRKIPRINAEGDPRDS